MTKDILFPDPTLRSESDIEKARAAFRFLCPDSGSLEYVVIEGEPYSKARPRVNGSGQVYNSGKQAAQERELGHHLRRNFKEPVRHTVAVACFFYRSTRRRIDVDNLLKQVMDAANGICWYDDSQVTAQLGIIELDPDNPRTVICIGEHQSSMQRVMNNPRPCEICKKEFQPAFHKTRYCSQACAGLGNGRGLSPHVKCRHCKKEFKRKNFKQIYCSNKCKHESRRRSEQVNHCDDCGKEVANQRAARCRECWRTWISGDRNAAILKPDVQNQYPEDEL